MNQKIATDHLGNKYPSEKKMCEKYGVNPRTFRRRIKKGESLETALTRKKRLNQYHKGPLHDHLGNRFNSEREMCKFWHIHVNTFHGRRERGWNLKEALTWPCSGYKTGNTAGTTTYKGKTYKTFKSACEENGKKASTVRKRIMEKGMSLDEAIEKEVKTKNKEVIYKGRTYHSFKSACEENGKVPKTIEKRMKNLGMSFDEAMKTEKVTRTSIYKQTNPEGIPYNNKKEKCEAYNVPLSTYNKRIEIGYTEEQALMLPIWWRSKMHKKFKALFEIGEVKYYAYECIYCNKGYIFSDNDAREHYLSLHM